VLCGVAPARDLVWRYGRLYQADAGPVEPEADRREHGLQGGATPCEVGMHHVRPGRRGGTM
jgi:hypothetical protein